MAIIQKLERVDNHFRTESLQSFDTVKDLPKEGGVYCIYKNNQAIYIGITDNLQRRLNYFVNVFTKNGTNHVGAITIKEIYPDNNLTDFQFKYFVENNLNLYSLYERYLICLYEKTLLNKK